VLDEYLSYQVALTASLEQDYETEVLGLPGDILLPWVLRIFLEDAAAYFFGDERENIRERLRLALREAQGPIAVLGHSLGGIITYDVLSEPEFSKLDVVHYVTFGTQLGVGEIQRKVHRPLSVPPGVKKWSNYYDFFDPSPMAQTLRDEFVPKGTIVDTEVDNLAPRNHDARGYLRTPEMRRLAGMLR
jgi:hypothetical protein